MKFALLVEGPSDESSLKILTKRIAGKEISVITRVLRGRGNLLNQKKILSLIKHDILLDHPDVSKIFLFVDSECTKAYETEREIQAVEKKLQQVIRCPLNYIGVIHALEGWLLGDPDVIKNYLGSKRQVNISSSVTNECRPKEVMKNIFKRANKEFFPKFHNPRIAEKININNIAKNNTSFRNFMDKVNAP